MPLSLSKLQTDSSDRHVKENDALEEQNALLDFARKLITETTLPLGDIVGCPPIANLADFGSAFRKRFRRLPKALRRPAKPDADGAIELSLPYRPPLDWDNLLHYYRAHHIAGIEAVDESSYARVFRHESEIGAFRVTHDRTKPQLRLRVLGGDPRVLFSIHQRVRRMFDLDCDPELCDSTLAAHRKFAPLWKHLPGLRVASGWDPFETSITTILGQLVSTRQARTLVAQLVENHGERITHPATGESAFLFPSPESLAEADLGSVRTSQSRKQAIRELSRLVAARTIDLSGRDNATAVKKVLLAIPGIGKWTAAYIGLRVLHDRDSFPGTDLVLKRALDQHPDLDLEALRPWRGYVAICLWSHYGKLALEKKEKLK